MSNQQKTVVLAYSGGLDTSFCIPWLIDKGFKVVTVFVDSGGISDQEKAEIKQRALSLGAGEHKEIDISDALWQQVIVPLIKSGQWYQGQYPLLCSDRYLIVAACLEVCNQYNTPYFAHGCTGMGNDQVRFDLAVKSLGDYQIISPIREIQSQTKAVRNYEIDYLKSKGFEASDKVNRYSVNENLLGATISGSEIDEWKTPANDSYILCKPPHLQETQPQNIQITFQQGVVTQVLISEQPITPCQQGQAKQLLQQLNQLGGQYGIGRDIYTGDTTIGLKGRIVFEAPALALLKTAHRALEQTVLSKAQQRAKAAIASEWTLLVYEGLFFDPLKTDIEAFLEVNQSQVTGRVTLQLQPGTAQAVEIISDKMLVNKDSVYAQSCDWSIEEATGFIKLFGQSTVLACQQRTVCKPTGLAFQADSTHDANGESVNESVATS